jgi:hypothetical protein
MGDFSCRKEGKKLQNMSLRGICTGYHSSVIGSITICMNAYLDIFLSHMILSERGPNLWKGLS